MRRFIAHSTVVAVLLAPPVCAQVGGGYDISRNTVDGGGATFSTAGGYRVGGTIGQSDAGNLNAGGVVVVGGFWPGVLHAPSPPSTPSATLTPSLTPTLAATSTPTLTPPATVPTGTYTPTVTPTLTPPVTVPPGSTPTLTPTNTPTPPVQCVGDCDGAGEVTINEIITMVNIALGSQPVLACSAGDADTSGTIEINEIIQAVQNSLNDCGR
jgi:hypothetical protein